MGSIQLAARPTPLEIEADRTAVVVVDMQNDFGSREGMFDASGIDISGIQAVVAPIGRVLDTARSNNIPVVYLKMEFRSDLSDLGPPDSPQRDRVRPAESDFLIRDTWGTEIVPALEPQAGDIIVSKRRYSGFFETELDAILRSLRISTLIFTGCTTSVCVESTVRDAAFRDYTCVVLADCVDQPNKHPSVSNHEASLLVIEAAFGWVSDSAAFTGAFAPVAAPNQV